MEYSIEKIDFLVHFVEKRQGVKTSRAFKEIPACGENSIRMASSKY